MWAAGGNSMSFQAGTGEHNDQSLGVFVIGGDRHCLLGLESRERRKRLRPRALLDGTSSSRHLRRGK
jgi:hypothetical protein